MKIFLVSILYSLLPVTICRAEDSVEAKIESILKKLTLEEKIGQLHLVDGHASGGWKPEHMALAKAGILGGTFNVRGTDPTSEMQHAALASRNGIPLVFAFDVVHGYRTIFPVPLGEAASWDPDLAEACAAAAAREARAAGVAWTFAPVADIARDPRWGRIVEGAGEDVVLCSAFTAARVRGFQGMDISASDRMLACLKHFAGSGAAEGGRDYNAAELSPRMLWQTYFPPFQAGLAAGAGSVMPSFHAIDGVPGTGNAWLLRNVLRDTWKFRGVVVTDYEAIRELINHRVVGNQSAAGLLALQSGVTVEMRSNCFAAAQSSFGKAELTQLDAAVQDVLQMKFRLGLFKKPFADAAREKLALRSDAHLKLARKAASQVCVLLKNTDHTLPIKPSARKIAILGPLADDRAGYMGSWMGDGRAEDTVTLVDAVKRRIGAQGKVLFDTGVKASGFSFKRPVDSVEAAKEADFIIVVVGETADQTGEAACRSSLDLPQAHIDMITKVQGLGKPYAVVLMCGRPMTVAWLKENCPAILLSWFGGTMGGEGLADVLFGDVNPSGKLPVTFPRSVGQIPLTYNGTPTGRPYIANEKWTSKYTDIENSPLWPFGFGLSYTEFELSAPNLKSRKISQEGKVELSVTVSNRGARDGAEVVQVYLRDEISTITRPTQELKAFRRVEVPAGKSVPIEFEIPASELGCWDGSGKYNLEAGTFTLMVGTSSVAVQETSFELD